MFDRILQILNKRKPSARAQAIRDGRLVDMQRPPFRQFNEILDCTIPLAMTKAAFEQFVRMPGEPRKKAAVPANFRWGIVFLTLVESQRNKPVNNHEALFEVNVMSPDGFQIARTLKVVCDGDGEEMGLTFMLPDEPSIPDE